MPKIKYVERDFSEKSLATIQQANTIIAAYGEADEMKKAMLLAVVSR